MIGLKKLRGDGGSIDLIQLVVGLLIISIASVGTLQSLVWGYSELDKQMRHRKAISIARSYMEYIQGRIHTDFDPANYNDRAMLAGNLANPEKKLLDEATPGADWDDIYCEVSHGPIVAVDDPMTGVGTDYWKIRVFVKWSDHGESQMFKRHEVSFESRMVPAAF